jgi:integrase
MAGRSPILEHEEPHLYDALPHFSLRDQALIVLGLNTGFRIHELLPLTVG